MRLSNLRRGIEILEKYVSDDYKIVFYDGHVEIEQEVTQELSIADADELEDMNFLLGI